MSAAIEPCVVNRTKLEIQIKFRGRFRLSFYEMRYPYHRIVLVQVIVQYLQINRNALCICLSVNYVISVAEQLDRKFFKVYNYR